MREHKAAMKDVSTAYSALSSWQTQVRDAKVTPPMTSITSIQLFFTCISLLTSNCAGGGNEGAQVFAERAEQAGVSGEQALERPPAGCNIGAVSTGQEAQS